MRLARDLSGFALYALKNDGTRLRELPIEKFGGQSALALSTDVAMAYELARR